MLELVGPALDKSGLTNYVFTSELNIDPLLMTMRSLVGSNIDLSSLGWASYLIDTRPVYSKMARISTCSRGQHRMAFSCTLLTLMGRRRMTS